MWYGHAAAHSQIFTMHPGTVPPYSGCGGGSRDWLSRRFKGVPTMYVPDPPTEVQSVALPFILGAVLGGGQGRGHAGAAPVPHPHPGHPQRRPDRVCPGAPAAGGHRRPGAAHLPERSRGGGASRGCPLSSAGTPPPPRRSNGKPWRRGRRGCPPGWPPPGGPPGSSPSPCWPRPRRRPRGPCGASSPGRSWRWAAGPVGRPCASPGWGRR